MRIVIEKQIVFKGKELNLYDYYYECSNGYRLSPSFQSSIERINEHKQDIRDNTWHITYTYCNIYIHQNNNKGVN